MDQINKWNSAPDVAGWQASFAPRRAPATKTQKKKKPWWTALISEGGATGGAVAGGATGAALGSVVPVAGTAVGGLLGAAIGGLAGGFGGSAVEQQIRDSRVNWKKAGLEGAISGVLLPGPLKLAGAGGAAAKAVATKKGVSEAVTKNLAKKVSVSPGGKVKQIGERAESRAGGIHVGARARGLPDTASYSKMQKFLQLDKEEGITATLPDIAAGQAEAALMRVGKEMGKLVKNKKHNRLLTAAEKTGLIKDIRSAWKKDATISHDPAVTKQMNQMFSGLKGMNTLEDVVKQSRKFKARISHTRNQQAAVPGREEALKLVSYQLDRLINKSAALRPLNKRYSLLKDREALAKELSNRDAANARRADVSFTGRVTAGDTAQSLKGRGGRALANASDSQLTLPALRRSPGAGRRSPAGYALRSPVASGLTQPMGVQEEPPVDMSNPVETDEFANLPSGRLPDELGIQTQQSMYPLEAALMDIQRDPKNTSTYLSIYKTVTDAGAGSAGKLDATSRRQVSNVEAAEQIVDQIDQLFREGGGAQGWKGYITQQTSRVPELGSDANAFRSIREGYLARIIRALGEVGTLNEGDIRRAVQLVPNFSDTPRSAQRKLDSLRQALQGYKQSIYQQGAGGSGDLTSALMQAQGQYAF